MPIEHRTILGRAISQGDAGARCELDERVVRGIRDDRRHHPAPDLAVAAANRTVPGAHGVPDIDEVSGGEALVGHHDSLVGGGVVHNDAGRRCRVGAGGEEPQQTGEGRDPHLHIVLRGSRRRPRLAMNEREYHLLRPLNFR